MGVLLFAHSVHHFVVGSHGDARDRLHVARHRGAEENGLPVTLQYRQ